MLKNISLPLFHRRGMSREGGSVFTTQFHLSLPPYLRVVLTYLFCFFSSRRRHTSLTCDWSSDVCSSDLARRVLEVIAESLTIPTRSASREPARGRRSEERRVGKSVDLGGRRIIKKKRKKKKKINKKKKIKKKKKKKKKEYKKNK